MLSGTSTACMGLLWEAGGGTVWQIQIRIQASRDREGHFLPIAQPVQATCGSTKTVLGHDRPSCAALH